MLVKSSAITTGMRIKTEASLKGIVENISAINSAFCVIKVHRRVRVPVQNGTMQMSTDTRIL